MNIKNVYGTTKGPTQQQKSRERTKLEESCYLISNYKAILIKRAKHHGTGIKTGT